MESDLLAVGAGFAGVVLGFVGSLVSASMQRKGSQAQADATYRAAVTTAESGFQAAVTTSETAYRAAIATSETAYRATAASTESQYRAAVTTARTQYASALESLNRTAQRGAYVSFLTAAAVMRGAAETAHDTAQRRDGGGELNLDDLDEAVHMLQAAYGAVELEGPPVVLAAAREALERAQTMATELKSNAYVPSAESSLARAASFLAPPESQPAAQRALEALREVRRQSMPTASEVEGEVDWNMPAAHQRAIVQAREALAAVTDLHGWQQRLLVSFAVSRPQGFSPFMRELQAAFAEASSAFVNAARGYLNDTQPDMSDAD